MEQSLMESLIEKGMLKKENVWISCFKALPISFLYIGGVFAGSIGKFFGIQNEIVAILIFWLIPLFLFIFLFGKYMTLKLVVITTYPKEFSVPFTILVALIINFYWFLTSKNLSASQILLTSGIAFIFQLYIWRKEIMEKIRTTK
jgi:hypothetical protein